MGQARRLLLVVLVALVAAPVAHASRGAQYGIQDDAWLAFGPGTIDQRLDTLDKLGVKLVRYTLRWDQIARTKPDQPRWSGDPAYDWGASDAVLKGLHEHGIEAVITIHGAPRWTNGGRSLNWAPTSGRFIADFAAAANNRFPWVRKWLIWNEPNKRMFLRPTTPKVYVQRILNPAYASLHAINARMRVAGGVTAPRAGRGGVSPIEWIRGMRRARARLDAYAHNPYPERPRTETPTSGGCTRCTTITMATLYKLQREVKRAWGAKRIWLTEYGYQTNPPDRVLGVSPEAQARYVGEAALKVYRTPYVDMLVHFLVRDDPDPNGWQSGFFRKTGAPKLSSRAFPLPLAQVSRRGTRTVLWGQVRSGTGSRAFRLQLLSGGRKRWIGGTRRTGASGTFQLTVRAGKGAKLRVWAEEAQMFGPTLVVR